MDENNSIKAIDKTNLTEQTKYRLSEIIGIGNYFYQEISQYKSYSKKLPIKFLRNCFSFIVIVIVILIVIVIMIIIMIIIIMMMIIITIIKSTYRWLNTVK